MVTVAFLQCLGMLFNLVNRTKRGISWGLVTHTLATFLPVMIRAATTLDLQFISFTNQRKFPGDDAFLHEPTGYKFIPLRSS